MEGNISNSSFAATNKRARVDSDESPESPRTKRLRDDLLDILDDVDDRNPEAHDLASVMKILEEEITAPAPPPNSGEDSSDSGESQPELGFLLEASDEELGLPPASTECRKPEENSDIFGDNASETGGFGQIWGFDDDIPSYGDFGVFTERDLTGDGEVVFDGLFDYSDGISAADSSFSDFSWRHESLPAM